ncbi:major facilitator superfamily domain-containing protein [Lasiosphaeria ovina]|uniref:Major facilitator superfamily domain-containing protein n=1 Tax=Lasiosphaeria ovina TaxID=92902 RepID=A0AAE0K4D3_9PEZI|nr:major facilitator superfamily domain-containing protein [Lasiosphaeria ovina]
MYYIRTKVRNLTSFEGVDSTIVATLTTVISTSFSSFNNLSWLGTACLVAAAATQPLAGRWTDTYGRRRGLLAAGLLFGIGTLVCGVATSERVFILGRVVAGAGGGAMNDVSTFVGADLVPLRKRGVIQGINNIAMGCGTGLGGLVGGLFNKWFGWKKAFLVQLPSVLLGLALCALVRDIPFEPAVKAHQRQFDYAGSFTLPTTRVRLALHRAIYSGYLTYMFTHIAVFAIMFYIPIYLQVRGSDPTHASLRFIPQSIGTAIGAYGAGLLIKATGNYIFLSAVSHIFLCPFVYLGMAALGFGGMLVTTIVGLISAVDHSEHAVVTSASFAFRAIGPSTGISVASLIFPNSLIQKLHIRLGNSSEIDQPIEHIRRNFDAVLDLEPHVRAEVGGAYMQSLCLVLHVIWID